ncbi:MAG: hypothetical protein V1853_01010 [bacterium]
MNSYFAAVEQQANPNLRGRPVGIAATMAPGGCLIATSKEAKAGGIVTGMRVREGLEADSSLKIVEVDPPKYRSTTEVIFRIAAEYSEEIEPYSIDEAFVDLTGVVSSLNQGAKVGYEFQKRIKNEVGEWLTCSVGVTPTRWLAKFASDTAPKGGLVILDKARLSGYLRGRPVTDAWGIARGLEKRLGNLGITTLDQLQRYPVTNLIEVLGVKGYELWANVNGIELSGVMHEAPPKSIGHSHVLRERTKNPVFHRSVLMKLCERTARALRQKNMVAHALWVACNYAPEAHLKMDQGHSYSARHKTDQGLYTSRIMLQIVWDLIEKEIKGQVVTFLAVGTFNLLPQSGQMCFWPEPNISKIEQVIDQLNQHYGAYLVQWGAMWGTRRHAQERVGFRKTIAASQVMHDSNPYKFVDTE